MTNLRRANNVADLRRMASLRLPRPIFDHIDGGADALADRTHTHVTRPCRTGRGPRSSTARPIYSLSTMGTTRLEDLAQAVAGPKAFQIYIF